MRIRQINTVLHCAQQHWNAVQEHAANRILQDLVKACDPLSMEITLDYKIRGGLHTKVKVRHQKK